MGHLLVAWRVLKRVSGFSVLDMQGPIAVVSGQEMGSVVWVERGTNPILRHR